METIELNPLEQEARAFAIERHGGQRYGEHPYVHHLTRVREVLARFGHHGALGVAAWLHDVLEDTPTTREEVTARFGAEVEGLVWAVTGKGQNRAERNASMYEKVRVLPAAATLKLGDRIANVESSLSVAGKLEMYRSEHAGFSEHLAGLGDPRMWAHLASLFQRP